MVYIIKQEISNLQNEVSNLEDNKESINKLTEENIHLKFEKKQYKEKYEELEEKTNYLVNHLNKVLSLFSFKHDYDPEERKVNQKFVRKHNLFNKREIEKATKH